MSTENVENTKKGNPLVTAERLHRFKCPYCGSKDKNIVDMNTMDDREDSETYNQWVKYGKIVCCNDCGHTMIFSHSSYALACLLGGNPISMKKSDEYVKKFHMENHEDPKINPHTGEDYPARNFS